MLSQYVEKHIFSDMQEEQVKPFCSFITDSLIELFSKFGLSFQLVKQPGLQDLVEGSPALLDIRARLLKLNIPMLGIGGVCFLSKLLNKLILESLESKDELTSELLVFISLITPITPYLDNLFTKLIVGKENVDQSHDFIIPLYSQLGTTTLAKSPNYHAVTIANTTHISSDDFGITGTLDSPETLVKIEEFVKR
ncbi:MULTISPECIES: hypothetical protein [unclassified Candidatus Cardinium]|uniref:hypothetical protein n=1 Tax=unclassified Candidatus Cardinium TaxID=2641185 RepID=UPI001FB4D5E7|nr:MULTISPECIES: hypothetical protein [unclassified Candidatus Cardinium]